MIRRQQVRKPPVRRADALLLELVAAIPRAPIREESIRDSEYFAFGDSAEDGTIRIDIGLLRVVVGIHELIHRARPGWSERAVRARTTRLLHAMTDEDVATLNAVLVDAITPTTSRRRRRS